MFVWHVQRGAAAPFPHLFLRAGTGMSLFRRMMAVPRSSFEAGLKNILPCPWSAVLPRLFLSISARVLQQLRLSFVLTFTICNLYTFCTRCFVSCPFTFCKFCAFCKCCLCLAFHTSKFVSTNFAKLLLSSLSHFAHVDFASSFRFPIAAHFANVTCVLASVCTCCTFAIAACCHDFHILRGIHFLQTLPVLTAHFANVAVANVSRFARVAFALIVTRCKSFND